MPELGTEEIKKRFDCIQSKEGELLVFKIIDTLEKTEMIVKADNIMTVDKKIVFGRQKLRKSV